MVMSEIGLRTLGKDPQGNAKGIELTKDGVLKSSSQSKLLLDSEFEVTLSGYHIFGETTGRANQQILDISAYKNKVVYIEQIEPGGVGTLRVSLYSQLGVTNGTTDSNTIKVITVPTVADGKYLLTSNDYPDLALPYIGLTVSISSPTVGVKLRVRVLGGN